MADIKQVTAGALEQFCVLAKTTKGKAVVALIQEVLKHPEIFVFGELLNLPNIKSITGTEQQRYVDLLKIFAYGTYKDYDAKTMPELTPPQLTKLKQLSIVTMASKKKTIPYAELMSVLDVRSTRELEDLVIECVYRGLLKARLDQRKERLEVQHAGGRDIGEADLKGMIGSLEEWIKTSQTISRMLSEKVTSADEEFRLKNEENESLLREIASLKTKAETQISENRSKKSSNSTSEPIYA
eukprot:264741_1